MAHRRLDQPAVLCLQFPIPPRGRVKIANAQIAVNHGSGDAIQRTRWPEAKCMTKRYAVISYSTEYLRKPTAYAYYSADGVGFQPTNPCGLAVFKTAALSRSATHPDPSHNALSMATSGTKMPFVPPTRSAANAASHAERLSPYG